MRSAILVICLILTSAYPLQAQDIPQVPSRLEFAGLKLIITDAARREIQKDVDRLRASDKYFRIKLDRALLYFPIIEKVFDEQGVPSDFKYLAVQESALISDVVSSSKAVGFWQFKDFTGREVGLRIDSRIDERKNIVAASRGAATYMKRNNFLYDNWIYALTAYYAGPGGAAKYAEKSNYGVSKMTIDKKTHWYVKRFLAHKIAFENELNNQHSDGMSLAIYSNGAGKDLGRIAKEFDMEEEYLQHYNKWLKFGKIPDDKQYSVIIPMENGSSQKLLSQKNQRTGNTGTAGTIKEPVQNGEVNPPREIKPGLLDRQSITIKINGVEAIMAGNRDNVKTLAAQGNISPEKFRDYNDLDNERILPGEIYYLERKKGRSGIGFHITEKGETMWSISQRFGIKLKKLYKFNRMEEGTSVKEGRLIWMNSRRPKDVAVKYFKVQDEVELTKKDSPGRISGLPEHPVVRTNKEALIAENSRDSRAKKDPYVSDEHYEYEGKKHSVAPGETLWSIARTYEVTVEELRDWNSLTKYDELRVNQQLFVEEPTRKVDRKLNRKVETYIVKPGDTMYRIASKHQMEVTELMNLNGRKNASLSIGEELKVYK